MTSQKRKLVRPFLGGGFVLAGAWLLALGVSFVSQWMTISAGSSGGPNPPGVCLCPLRSVQLLATPDFRPIAISYLVAIPTILGVAFWIGREARRVGASERDRTGIRRIASRSLIGAMAWMTTLFAFGFALSGPPPIGLEGSLRSVFLVSLLLVPAVVVGMGVAVLWDWQRGNPQSFS